MFRLLHLEFENHAVLGNLSVDFMDDPVRGGPYSTLIIGPNGSGKSFLLKAIIDLFLELENLKLTSSVERRMRGGYKIKYGIGEDVYEIDTFVQKRVKRTQSYKIIVNGRSATASEILLPQKLIATSVLLNDRFPVIKKESQLYRYQGIRRTPSTAGTKVLFRNVLFNILGNINRVEFRDAFLEVLDFLGYQHHFEVGFWPKYRTKLFHSNLTEETFSSFFLKWKEERANRTTKPWSVGKFEKIRDDNDHIRDLVSLIHKISASLRPPPSGGRSLYYYYNIFEKTLTPTELEDLEILYELDLLTDPTINLRKTNREIELSGVSAGEFHVLGSMIGMLSGVSENSLILIDEPEISLHPEWQTKYFYLLKKVLFKKYPGVHFVVTSHSHFFVSDLEPSTSSLIALRCNEKIEAEQIKYETHGWSAEQILLEVFRVPTTRNYYVTERVGKILDLIAQPERDTQEIYNQLNGLRELHIEQLSDMDPLKDVINKLFDAYANR